jgi:hypothetical protein
MLSYYRSPPQYPSQALRNAVVGAADTDWTKNKLTKALPSALQTETLAGVLPFQFDEYWYWPTYGDTMVFQWCRNYTLPELLTGPDPDAYAPILASEVSTTAQGIVNLDLNGAVRWLANRSSTTTTTPTGPSVTIIGASTGTAGTQQLFSATVLDPDSTPSKVELCVMADATTLTNFTVQDLDLFAPFDQLKWTPAAAGNFNLRTRVTDNLGRTAFSPVQTVAVQAATVVGGQLLPPTNVRGQAINSTTNQVDANTVANASGYWLYASDTQTGTFVRLGGTLLSPTYTEENLQPLQTRWYKWLALGTSPYSNSVQSGAISVTTTAGSVYEGKKSQNLVTGDSLDAGYGTSDPSTKNWGAQLYPMLDHARFSPLYNTAVSGRPTSAILAAFDTEVLAIIDVNTYLQLTFTLGSGINSLVAGDSIATIKAQKIAIIQKLRAFSAAHNNFPIKIILETVTPNRKIYGPTSLERQERMRQAMNADMLATYSTDYGADYVMNWDSNPDMLDYNDTRYYLNDGEHFTDAGQLSRAISMKPYYIAAQAGIALAPNPSLPLVNQYGPQAPSVKYAAATVANVGNGNAVTAWLSTGSYPDFSAYQIDSVAPTFVSDSYGGYVQFTANSRLNGGGLDEPRQTAYPRQTNSRLAVCVFTCAPGKDYTSLWGYGQLSEGGCYDLVYSSNASNANGAFANFFGAVGGSGVGDVVAKDGQRWILVSRVRPHESDPDKVYTQTWLNGVAGAETVNTGLNSQAGPMILGGAGFDNYGAWRGSFGLYEASLATGVFLDSDVAAVIAALRTKYQFTF